MIGYKIMQSQRLAQKYCSPQVLRLHAPQKILVWLRARYRYRIL